MALAAAVLDTGLPSIDGFLAGLPRDGRVVHVERLPARAARHGDPRRPLPDGLLDAFGVERLWTHQARAIDLARAGRSVAVATGTSSGKSLCFQVPIAEAVARDMRAGTALALFPTKALAQDQLRALGAAGLRHLVAATYDGDTSREARTWVRRHANVLLTNPEMLHVGILPHHERWATFLARLRYVVVDELHTLRGIFGSHVAHLLRRLRRVCAHYGSEPTFLFSSATIGQPSELASALSGLPVEEVTDDGSPRGDRWFVLWNPSSGPVPADEPHDRRPASANRETATLVAELVARGHQTIAFCRSRKGTELVAAEVRGRLPVALAHAVRPYRGGYLSGERRAIEAELFAGRLRAVVATTALELGVDIGCLDACVLDGFPGSIASMWQQAGRAGRGTRPSVAVLVAGDDQLDQWLMAHPDEVFRRAPEPAVVNPSNPFVLLPQLACAAYELPLRPGDERWWPDLLDEGVRRLVLDDQLRLRPRRPGTTGEPVAVWAGRGWPARGVGLRSGSDDEFHIERVDGSAVGTVDASSAFRQVHPGAVYLHQGQAFRVRTLELDDRVAVVEPSDGSEYTQPRTDTDIALLATENERWIGTTRLGLGPVRVRSKVVGYKRFDSFTGETIGSEELYLPPSELVTRGFWFALAPEALPEAEIGPAALGGTLHAIEHAAIGLLPLFTICDRWDVGGVSSAHLPETGGPTIVVYDGYPGGAGVAELGFGAAESLLDATLELVRSCHCADGCPSCVHSPDCGNGNEPLDKAGAIRLLEVLTRPDPC